MEILSEMGAHTVSGRNLVPMGRIAGRMVYTLTSRGETWRFTPDVKARYMVRRLEDGSYRECDTLEAAVAFVDAFEHQSEGR